MKIAWSVGEASGDVIAASMLSKFPGNVEHLGVAGPMMRKFNINVFQNQERLAVMGILDVVLDLPFFIKYLARWKAYLIKEKPNLLICVDYPGFNLKLQKFARQLGIAVLVIAPPQIWAWKQNRFKNYLSVEVVCLFDFEKKKWDEVGIQAHYFGHPSVEIAILQKAESIKGQKGRKADLDLLLCPGSRIKSAKRNLETYLKLLDSIKKNTDTNPGKVGVLFPNLEIQTNLIIEFPQLNELYQYVLTQDDYPKANLAWTSLGTNTLELSLRHIPQIVIHKLDILTYLIGRAFVKTKLFALPSILCERKVVEEIIFNKIKISELARRVQTQSQCETKQLEDYQVLTHSLGMNQDQFMFSSQCVKWILRTYRG